MDDSERYHWERIAEDDRRRYNEEMKAYVLAYHFLNSLRAQPSP